jgi:hypothetical protein
VKKSVSVLVVRGAAALCSKANAGSTFNVQEFKEKQTRGNFHVSGIPETWK